MATKPWEHAKTSGSGSDPLAARFVESLSYDRRIYKHDIAGSIAHARMLRSVELLDDGELAAIEAGLVEIEKEIDANFDGWAGWQIELEDVHMCIEAALIEKIGDPGRKLHTGRSRNDQVAFDLYLWVDHVESDLLDRIDRLCKAFVELAERDGEIVMPSYTHLQRAQPIVVGGELLAWASAFERAADRVHNVVLINRMHPLGSGAIAGTSLPLDRDHVSLNMNDYAVGPPSMNSIDATASRDIAVDFVFALSMVSLWLSRFAEQWIIYATTEFGFVKLDAKYTTGSSMMPQKQNPDMLELIRGRCGNVYGNLVALLTTLKGIPIGYNRDLQEDKRHVFAAYDMVCDCLDMATRIVATAKFDEKRIAAGLDRGFLDATSLAEYLVTKGVPFRTAHQVVGRLVRQCQDGGLTQLADLKLEQMRQACESIGDDVYDWLGAANVVKRYQSVGNAGLTGFHEQLAAWKQRIGS
jgi:argininosuccinate lyase